MADLHCQAINGACGLTDVITGASAGQPCKAHATHIITNERKKTLVCWTHLQKAKTYGLTSLRGPLDPDQLDQPVTTEHSFCVYPLP